MRRIILCFVAGTIAWVAAVSLKANTFLGAVLPLTLWGLVARMFGAPAADSMHWAIYSISALVYGGIFASVCFSVFSLSSKRELNIPTMPVIFVGAIVFFLLTWLAFPMHDLP